MKLLLVKIVGNGLIVVAGLLLMTEATLLESLITAIILTLIAYLIGDRLILPNSNNITATLCDAVMAGLILWAAAAFGDWGLAFGELLVVVAFLGVFEYGLHIALLKEMGMDERKKTNAIS